MSDCVCASAISAEMKDWVALGGGNSGCCGNAVHTYGFHCPATAVPTSDYSRRHDAGKPYRMNWGCAGDFHHGYDAKLMAMHADVLGRLMTGGFPMIAEMITKPWKNKPVYYWARWNGIATLQKYTGKGHDHWSHISWFRSKANIRANLWVTGGASSVTPAADRSGSVAPKYPGYVLRRSAKADANVRIWQAQAKAKGYTLSADGIFGPGTETVVAKVQSAKGLNVDKVIGPKTWAVMWVR